MSRFTASERLTRLLAVIPHVAGRGYVPLDEIVQRFGYPRADLVAVRLDTVRTAAIDPAQVIFAASAADVDAVLVDGAVVVERGRHRLGDVGRLLAEAIEPLWRDA